LKPGDILKNKMTIYPIGTKLSFSPRDYRTDKLYSGKYFIIKNISRIRNSLIIDLIWASVFRHAENMGKKIKNGDDSDTHIPPMYKISKSINQLEEYFKIIQPKDYDNED
jgi:hypothetical protein